MKTTVVLIDDHALIRQGLRRAFEQSEDFDVIAEASGAAEGLAMVRAHRPDVVVVDLNLGDGSGLEVVQQLRADRPDIGLVVCTMYDGDEHLFGAFEAGASGFVLKSAPAQDVVSAARQAVVAPASFAAADLAGAMRRRIQTPPVRLTQRENECLQLLAEGLAVTSIAKRLFISESTAKTHMSKLYEKLGASNRSQALMEAVRLGIVKTGAPRN